MVHECCYTTPIADYTNMTADQKARENELFHTVRWLEGTPRSHAGTTFGLPWSAGRCFAGNTIFKCVGDSGAEIPLQSWITAYWQDGSIKWTGHAISGSTAESSYTVRAVTGSSEVNAKPTASHRTESGLKVIEDANKSFVEVQTGRLNVRFGTQGSSIVQRITTSTGKITGRNGRLVLLSQSSVSAGDLPDPTTAYFTYLGNIDEVVVEQSGFLRAVVAIRGHHQLEGQRPDTHKPWLPFTLRFYLYAHSDTIRLMHTIVYDGDEKTDFIRGLGIRFDVPMKDELYDRHIRISGVDGGVFSEAVQGITGLRINPGPDVRAAQVLGLQAPPIAEWDTDVSSRLKWVPSWNDFSLAQNSPDGFNLQKRTKAGCSWVKIPSGTRAGGLAYLGGATGGGLGIGMKDFWERYPTGIDIRNAASEEGEVTLWLYNPSAGPMDLRQHHDGLNQKTYDEQLDALWITYEDWEEETGSPYGVARTNEIYITSFDQSPTSKTTAELTELTREPPMLVASSEATYKTKAFGHYWSPASYTISNPSAAPIHSNLDFLFNFHKSQIGQRRWYGFWDHGDIMHAYDADRHTWRYDIGGYAWDNSELSPDLWLWLYFLQTGRADVYRMAESLTRHTGEVDVYHLGKHKGLGTRHGVQHWSDSCKQARISNALYRKYFYYLSGGDERVGELLEEVLETEKAFLVLDPYRKVRKDRGSYIPDPRSISISLGTDWAAIAAAWIISVERRGPHWKAAESKLLSTIRGIGNLANGFVTGSALYNTETGELHPPSQDPENKGVVQISHLSAMFGLFEVCAELIDLYPSLTSSSGFERAWLEYCRYFNGTPQEQLARYGVAFGKLQLRQGHSRLTAYAASRLGDRALARRAWEQFFLEEGFGEVDGYGRETRWETEKVGRWEGVGEVEEVRWVSTNISALYGIAGIQNLALVGDLLGDEDP